MQKTINVNGDKIKVIVKRSTHLGNHAGFIVKVNDKKYKFFCLRQQEAFEKGYVKYIKENR